MLHQNWFMNPRFEMFEDYGESQSFFDTQTGIIYVVFEEYGQKGSTVIQEITEESLEYKPNFERYKAHKGKHYRVKFMMSDEYVVKASNPDEAEQIAKEQFEKNYLVEVNETVITEIDEPVLYICK